MCIWLAIEACSKASLPDDIVINDERFTSYLDRASELNEYFANFSSIFGKDNNDILDTDISHLENLVHDKVPDEVYFKIPRLPLYKFQRLSTLLTHLKH